MLDLDARAEHVKLARLLGVAPDAIAFVRDQPSPATRAFRESVSDALFSGHRHGFQRLAGLTRLLPTGIAAALAEKLLGATLSARIASELEPAQAVALARKLPVPFLARVSIQLEPKRAQELIRGMPVEVVVAVALELVDKGEYITMGRFVDVLSDAALKACILAITGDAALLQVGFFAESKERLDTIVRLLSHNRLKALIQAATDHELWPEALSLIVHLDDELKGRMGDITAAQPEAVIEHLMEIAHTQKLWGTVLIAVANMKPENRRRVVNLKGLEDPEMIASLVEVGHEAELWYKLLPLMWDMDEPRRIAAAEAALAQSPEHMRGMFESIAEHQQWEQAIDVLGALPKDLQQRIGATAARHFGKSFRPLWAEVEKLGRVAELKAVQDAYLKAIKNRGEKS